MAIDQVLWNDGSTCSIEKEQSWGQLTVTRYWCILCDCLPWIPAQVVKRGAVGRDMSEYIHQYRVTAGQLHDTGMGHYGDTRNILNLCETLLGWPFHYCKITLRKSILWGGCLLVCFAGVDGACDFHAGRALRCNYEDACMWWVVVLFRVSLISWGCSWGNTLVNDREYCRPNWEIYWDNLQIGPWSKRFVSLLQKIFKCVFI